MLFHVKALFLKYYLILMLILRIIYVSKTILHHLIINLLLKNMFQFIHLLANLEFNNIYYIKLRVCPMHHHLKPNHQITIFFCTYLKIHSNL